MAPVPELQIGQVTALTQNTVYALPARLCMLFTIGTPTIKIANDLAMTSPVTVTLDANGQMWAAGGFIQSTGGAINISLKAL